MDARSIGEPYPTTEAWKERVRKEFRERGITLAEAADYLGARAPSVHYLLSAKCKSSALVPGIHRMLHWRDPTITISQNRQEIVSLIEKLSDDGVDWIRKQIAMYIEMQEKLKK